MGTQIIDILSDKECEETALEKILDGEFVCSSLIYTYAYS
jgi:hypothetical protein